MLETSDNDTELNERSRQRYTDVKGSRIKKMKLEWYNFAAKENATKKAMHWTEQEQLNYKYVEWKLQFIKMMASYASMWDGHLGEISVAQHRIHLNPPNAPLIHVTSYRAELRQS